MATTWETIEERERRVRGTRTTTTMTRAAAQVPTGKTLQEVFAARPFISREDLRSIATQAYEGPVITLYMNFTPERLVRADRPVFLSIFNSLRHMTLESRKEYVESLPHGQRLRVPEDLREIQEFLDRFEPQGARALVILKSGPQLNRIMPLPVRVADSLTIDADAYIQPLEAMMEEQHRVLVMDVAKDETVLASYELGYEHPIRSVTEELPREGTDEFRTDKEERHRRLHVKWQFKSAAQLADRLVRESGFDFVVMIGEPTVVKEFEDYLSKPVRDRLIGQLQLSPGGDTNSRRAALDEVLNQQRKKEEEAAIAELGFFKGHGRLASGLSMVLKAANLFLMRQLLVSQELTEAGFICRNHHYLALRDGTCPFDAQPLQAAENIIDELIEIARLHGVEVMVVGQRQDLLAPHEGIAAVMVTAASLDELHPVSVTS
jgi:hypothetical protein